MGLSDVTRKQEGKRAVLEGTKAEGMELIQAALVKARAEQQMPAPAKQKADRRAAIPFAPVPQQISVPPQKKPAKKHKTNGKAHPMPAAPAPVEALARPALLSAASPQSVWDGLQIGRPDPWRIEQGRLVTVGRTDPAHVAFDILRTKVMHVMRENDWKSLMITSPTARCGKTVVGLNLAFSLANQKDCRTALVDLDLRRPQVAEVLGVKSPPSMEEFLKGNITVENMFSRYGENLAVAANNRPVRMAAELLQSPEAARAASSVRQKLAADIVIFDLPPMLANDDVMGFLPNVDCAILVVAAEESTVSEVDLCERELSEKTNLLGTVLNKCRYAPEKYGY